VTRERRGRALEGGAGGRVVRRSRRGGGAVHAAPFAAQPDCCLIVYRRTRTHPPHPPPWPDRSFPFQLNLTVAHGVLVHPYTLAASSSLAWPRRSLCSTTHVVLSQLAIPTILEDAEDAATT